MEAFIKEVSQFSKKGEFVNQLALFDHLGKINEAISSSSKVDQVIDNILDAVFTIFDCDRVWLSYPCDPDTLTIQVLAEKYKDEYPGAFVLGKSVPIDEDAAETIRKAISSGSPVTFGPGSDNEIDDVTAQYSVLSQMMMAIHPQIGKAWMFGMHQCSFARVWDHYEQLLFKEIGYRVVDSLNNILLMQDLKQSEQKYKQFFTTVPNGWAYHKIIVDQDNKPIDYIFLEINDAFERLTGLKRKDIIGKKITEVFPGVENDPADWIGVFGKTALEGNSVSFENYALPIKRWYAVTASSPKKEYFITVFEDITRRKQAEIERDGLIHQLQEAFSEVKTLRGILPICSFCKKIRDDKGYWKQVEIYVKEHTNADFSHSLCPDCLKHHYPEFGDDD